MNAIQNADLVWIVGFSLAFLVLNATLISTIFSFNNQKIREFFLTLGLVSGTFAATLCLFRLMEM